jgi:AraC-like DNA-binding protein
MITESGYEKLDILNLDFPIIFHHDIMVRTSRFTRHWHEKIELLYFKRGEGYVICNAKKIYACPGVLVVVNSNEMHEIRVSSEPLEYYCLIIDNHLFKSLHTDVCETKYIGPIYQNQIVFKNRIYNDENISRYFDDIIREFDERLAGHELAIKGLIFGLMVRLLRNHVETILTPKQYDSRARNLNRINNTLQYIAKNYNRNITVEELCGNVNLSKYYFLRLFKKATGRSVIDYINYVKINKAEEMLLNSDVNITEAAFACGFNDANYFSRVFKKYKGKSPSEV